MNTQFHIPSFGDEVFDLTDVGSNSSAVANANGILSANSNYSYMYPQQTEQLPSQGLQNKKITEVNNITDEYYSANDDTCVSSTTVANHNSSNTQHYNSPNNIITSTATTSATATRKQLQSSAIVNNGNASDPNEPTKPVSAYALFFRDTVSAIKHENPNCPFQELSRIVASMWDVLDPVHKNVYNKRNEIARNEYIKQIRIYRQQQLEQQQTMKARQQQQEQTQILVSNELKYSPQQIQGTSTSFSINANAHETHANVNGQQHQQHHSSVQQQQSTQYGNSPTTATEISSQQQWSPIKIANVIISNSTNVASNTAAITSTTPGPLDKQTLSEDSAMQKCTRENCNKRAIINPDWEDEYCSNECVVIHCRNVFNAWVQSKNK
uniref:HMG box domain-containing protein n=1 Tax=Glossina pallidipes TaxID=7398 RepID=A0A1A9Z392_GLOPL